MEKITLKDIAQRLGISIVAVSKALNNKDGISEKLRVKVKKTALDMGYTNAVMKHELEYIPKCVGVVISERALNPANMTQAFYLGFFQKLSEILLKSNYFAQMYVLTEREESRQDLPTIYRNKSVVGLIFLGELSKEYMKAAETLLVPKILLDFYDKDVEIGTVVTDNMNCSYEITRMLIGRGHRKIGFIGSVNATSSIQDRYMGFYKAMVCEDLPVPPEWVIKDRDEKGVYVDIELPEILPTAFVCNSDRAAYGLIHRLKERGLRVPEDLSVVGFDNDIFSMVSDPPLTTVAVNMEEMSEKAVGLLFAALKDKDTPVTKLAISGRTILRSSVKEPK